MKLTPKIAAPCRLAVSVLVLIGLIDGRPWTSATDRLVAAPILANLQGVDELKALFNRDVGKVRLVLLLSPT